MEAKGVEIHLGYGNEGYDLAEHLDECKTIGEALEAQAKQLEWGAAALRRIKEIIGDDPSVSISTGGNQIVIYGPDAIIAALIKAGVVVEDS